MKADKGSNFDYEDFSISKESTKDNIKNEAKTLNNLDHGKDKKKVGSQKFNILKNVKGDGKKKKKNNKDKKENKENKEDKKKEKDVMKLDIETTNLKNPQYLVEYTGEIFNYLKVQEVSFFIFILYSNFKKFI